MTGVQTCALPIFSRVTVDRDSCPRCAAPGREKIVLHRLAGADPEAGRPLAELGVRERGVVALRMPDGATRHLSLGPAFW